MGRILFTTMPLAGHLRPGLPIARELRRAGHEVSWYTGSKYAHLITGLGVRHEPMAAGLDFDDAEFGSMVVRRGRKPGLAELRRAIVSVFVDPVPALVQDLAAVIDRIRPDVVVADEAFLAGPLAAEVAGIPRVVFSVTPLAWSGPDTAPFGTGIAPSATRRGRMRNRLLNRLVRHVLFGDVQRRARRLRVDLGLVAVDRFFLDWGVAVADRYLCATVPELEYPRRDLPPHVEFIGALLPGQGDDSPTLPDWWPVLGEAAAAGRPVVLVTQGTLATDPENLLLPAARALASLDAVVVATVGPDLVARAFVDSPPSNLVVAPFVPFASVLPMVDVLVTNGGFGGVQLALANGVPLVVAGTTEDKLEVGARVARAGAGVALRTDWPREEEILEAVQKVLGDTSFLARARTLQQAYARYDAAARAAAVVTELARPPRPGPPPPS